MRYYLGLDNGGTATKATVFDEAGHEIAGAAVRTDAIVPCAGHVERNMDEMWQANCTVIRQAVRRAGIDTGEIAAVAVCGHGKGLYLWGKDDRPVRNGITSSDSRGVRILEGWRGDGVEKALFPRTLQHMMACQPTVLLRWLEKNEPETLENIQWIFSCKDYLRFRLTGVPGAELTDISGSGFLNLNTRDYDVEILRALGLEKLERALPPLCRADAVCGYVTRRAAAETGLRERTPVAGGMFDIDACALALGVTDPGSVCMIAGTWSINEYISAAPVVDGSIRMNSLYCLPEYYLIEESSPTSAGALEWVIDTLLPEVREQAVKDSASIYEITSQYAQSVPVSANCPVFFPYLAGGSTNAAARGLFAGLDGSHTRAHLLRAVYEGIVFTHRQHFERLCRTGARWERIRLTGGASRSPFWAQMFADVMDMPVEAIQVNECGNLGCAMAAATAAGAYPDLKAAAAAMSPEPVRYQPNAENVRMYREKYQRYLSCLPFAEKDWQ